MNLTWRKLFCPRLLFLSAYWCWSSIPRSIKSININQFYKLSFKIHFTLSSFLKSSKDSAEFEAWLQEKERLNSNIKKVCRDRKVDIKIRGPSFMHIKPTNILFCVNQKVTQTLFIPQIFIWLETCRWVPQPGYLTSFSCQVCVESCSFNFPQ